MRCNKIKGEKRCNGTIIVDIDLYNAPTYGGTDPEIEIIYRCSRCPKTHQLSYEEMSQLNLPKNVDEIQKQIQEILNGKS